MPGKISLASLMGMKHQGRPITMLTCYDAPTARLLQDAGVDSLLVGDSLAQVILGYDSTVAATMDLMVPITAAVRRGAPEVYLIGDMPFLSYQVSREEAIRNAGRFLAEAGCDAVKVEVDGRHAGLVGELAAAGIAVMAHLGYRPQSAGQSVQIVGTRQVEEAVEVVRDAEAMVEAGACLLLLECVTAEVGRAVTERCGVPVISCGSGVHCDGQVLVLQEVMGLPGAIGPRFCRRYAELGKQMSEAAVSYIEDVRQGRFPDDEHSYHLRAGDQEQFDRRLREGGAGGRVGCV